MIGLMIRGCCNECDHIDLHLDAICFKPYNRPVYQLRCTHQEICGALAREAAEHPLAPLDQEY